MNTTTTASGVTVAATQDARVNRPHFPRYLVSLTLGPTRRCHEQAAFS